MQTGKSYHPDPDTPRETPTASPYIRTEKGKMPEPGVRGPCVAHCRVISIAVEIRTQWEMDHWIAEHHGMTAAGESEADAMGRLCAQMALKRWRIDA